MKVLATNVKLNAAPSVALWSASALATVGASLVLATAMLKVLVTEPPLPSSAATSMLTVPTSPLVGVPLKVRVAASKFSQLGSATPPVRSAV